MTGIIKTDQLQGAQSTTVTVPTGHTLAVTGNATVGGDLTVDTSSLKVDSTNNRVGVGTASPSVPLDVGDNDFGSAGTTGIQIQNSQDFTTVYDGTNPNTFAGMQTVNHDDTSNRTGTGVTFVHRSSSSGIASIQSTSAASDRADLRFVTRGSDGINERASITEAGYLKQNKLPMFQIAGTGNTSVTGTGSLTYTTSTGFSSSTEYDPDSLFNGANGRFTAPVAGRYFFIFSIGVSFTSSYHYTSIQKNGSDISGFSRNQQQEDDYDIQVIQGIVDLAENDYVSAARNNNYVTGAISRPMFCGFLLG